MADDAFIDPETGQIYYNAPGNKLTPVTREELGIIRRDGWESFDRSFKGSLESAARLPSMIGSAEGYRTQAPIVGDIAREQELMGIDNPGATLAGSVTGDIVAGAVPIGVPGAAGASAGVRMVTGAAVRGSQRGSAVARGIIRRDAQRDVPEALASGGYRAPFYAGRGEAARQIGAGIESNPFINIVTRAGVRQEQRDQAINNMVGRSVLPSYKGTNLNDGFYVDAKAAFKQEFGDIGRQIGPMSADQIEAFSGQIDQLIAQNRDSLTKSKRFNKIAERLRKRAFEGRLSGEQLMADRSELNSMMQAQYRSQSGDTGLAQSLERTIEVVDRAMEAAMGPEAVRDYAELRMRYRIWKNLLKGRAVSSDGNVRPQTLQGNMARDFGRGGPIEDNQMFQALNYVLEEGVTGVPNSGTATRQAIGQAITGAGLLGGYNILQ